MGRFAVIACLLPLACAFALEAQTDRPVSDPAIEATMNAASQVSGAPEDILAAWLPSAAGVLQNGGPEQRVVATQLLLEVARRRDGLALLKPWLPLILGCLRDRTPGVAGVTEYILLNLFPQPVETVVPYLIDYVNDEKVNEELRAGGISTLVWYAPNDPAVLSAMGRFMNADHGKEARAGAIRGMGLMLSDGHRYSPGITKIVLDSLAKDSEIRIESIAALGRCGWNSFAAVNPVLVAIAGDETESPEIRAAAGEAIESLLQSPRDLR
jgi:hypothetical protein